jgi:nucleoporin GLE1
VLVTAAAAAEESALAAELAAARATAAPFRADEALKAPRRQLERRLVLCVTQLSATREQVARKGAEIEQLLLQPHVRDSAPATAHLLLWLAEKLLAQAEAQVSRLRGFAYALAELVARLAPRFPALPRLITGQLHEACVLTVPKYYPYSAAAYPSREAYFGAMGYQRAEGGAFESTDAFAARAQCYITLYAALLQADAPDAGLLQQQQRDPRGFGAPPPPPPPGPLLPSAWAFLARLLNRLPPTRLVGGALEAFLEMAAWRLHVAYGRQFDKLLGVIATDFLPKLMACGDADAAPTAVRLRAFLEDREHGRPHGGRELPQSDLSSSLKG